MVGRNDFCIAEKQIKWKLHYVQRKGEPNKKRVEIWDLLPRDDNVDEAAVHTEYFS